MRNVAARCLYNENVYSRGKVNYIVPGKNYLIDTDSIVIDSYRHPLGNIRDENGNFVDILLLEHFDTEVLKDRRSFMRVICRDTHRICQNYLATKVIPGNIYLIDRNSIFVKNGTAYGNVYTVNGEYITTSFLKNFQTV